MATKDLSKAKVSLVGGQRDIPLKTLVEIDGVEYAAVRVRHLLAFEVGQFMEEAIDAASKLVEGAEDNGDPPGLKMFSLIPSAAGGEVISDLTIGELEYALTDEDRQNVDRMALDFLPYRLRMASAPILDIGAATSQASQQASTPPSEKSESSPGGNS